MTRQATSARPCLAAPINVGVEDAQNVLEVIADDERHLLGEVGKGAVASVGRVSKGCSEGSPHLAQVSLDVHQNQLSGFAFLGGWWWGGAQWHCLSPQPPTPAPTGFTAAGDRRRGARDSMPPCQSSVLEESPLTPVCSSRKPWTRPRAPPEQRARRAIRRAHTHGVAARRASRRRRHRQTHEQRGMTRMARGSPAAPSPTKQQNFPSNTA